MADNMEELRIQFYTWKCSILCQGSYDINVNQQPSLRVAASALYCTTSTPYRGAVYNAALPAQTRHHHHHHHTRRRQEGSGFLSDSRATGAYIPTNSRRMTEL